MSLRIWLVLLLFSQQSTLAQQAPDSGWLWHPKEIRTLNPPAPLSTRQMEDVSRKLLLRAVSQHPTYSKRVILVPYYDDLATKLDPRPAFQGNPGPVYLRVWKKFPLQIEKDGKALEAPTFATRSDYVVFLNRLVSLLREEEVELRAATAVETAAQSILQSCRAEFSELLQETKNELNREFAVERAELLAENKRLKIQIVALEKRMGRQRQEILHACRQASGAELERFLAPTVQFNSDDTVGSGTVVKAIPVERDGVTKWRVLVLTAYHVIRNAMADTPSIKTHGIPTTFYSRKTVKVDSFTRGGKKYEFRMVKRNSADTHADPKADLVFFDEPNDIAIVELRELADQKPPVAELPTWLEASASMQVQNCFNSGCPLGNDTVVTGGLLHPFREEIKGGSYWIITADGYFGNSGGGVYTAGNHKLVGVFSKIYTHGRHAPKVIPHMGLVVPMNVIYFKIFKSGNKVAATLLPFDMPDRLTLF